jgi:hypothetical protein
VKLSPESPFPARIYALRPIGAPRVWREVPEKMSGAALTLGSKRCGRRSQGRNVLGRGEENMDSIHRQEMEDPRKDLSGGDAITVIREIVEHADTCFFCTSSSSSDSTGVRPMRSLVSQCDRQPQESRHRCGSHCYAVLPVVTALWFSAAHGSRPHLPRP